MIKIEVEKLDGSIETKQIPVSWRDIKWSKFVEIEGTKFDNEVHRLSVVSGVEIEYLLNNLQLLNAIYEACSFMYEDLTEWMEYVPHKYTLIDVGAVEWGKIEGAKAAILKQPENKWSGGAEVVKYYTDEDINERPCVEVIGVVAFFLSKLPSFSTSTNS